MDVNFSQHLGETHRADAGVLLHEITDIYRYAPVGMALFSLDHRYLRINERMADFNGVSIANHIGQSIFDVVPDVADWTKDRIDKVVAKKAALARHLIDRINPVTGEPNSYAVYWYPVFGNDGDVHAVGAIAEDVTNERKHEQMLRHVARELQHRVRNALANVVALVDQATRSTHNASDALSVLRNRIGALAKTHGRLTEENWSKTSLSALLRQELTDVYGEKAVTVTGPDIRMTAQTALSFSMALHEMAANAMHYGALSQAGGHIDLRWFIEDDTQGNQHLVFNWKETGGPTLNCAHVAGFGTRLIDASINTSLRGRIERFWDVDGLRYHFYHADEPADRRVARSMSDYFNWLIRSIRLSGTASSTVA